MALPSITASDFGGFFSISQAQVYQAELTSFISEFYAKFVREVIGDKAYSEVNSQVTLSQKWLDLFNGVGYVNVEQDKFLLHNGLRRVAIGNIYFYWVRESGVYNTPTGTVQNKNGNSVNMGGYLTAQSRYNTVMYELIEQVYPFIRNYEMLFGFVISSIDLGGNAYTINVADTTYLYDGDLVKIDGIEYQVTNVIASTSFDITASETGLNFAGNYFYYEPYKDFPLPDYLASVL